MPVPFRLRLLPAVLAVALAGCSDDETGPEETHTPHRAAVFVGGIDASQNLLLPAGEAVRVEVRFYNEQDEEITGIDDDHFASLTFTPDDFATVAEVAGEHFQKDVTGGGAIGTGTFVVGYGHDEAADEEAFGPFDATVVATGAVTR
ncbi:MAG TPA: hypothetical protein VFT84_00415 [Gemmatimonadales bacterium]|nr:hypothetical protein [Gemmatimonadales bacterium]